MNYDAELLSLQLDKPGRGKTPQELLKHTINVQFDNLPVERSIYLLRKGDDIQKLSVIQALPQLLKTDRNDTLSKIIPKIQQELPNSSCEFHLATSKVFKILLQQNLPINIVSSIVSGMESKDPIISNVWLDTLVAVIPNLGEKAIKEQIIPQAVAKSQATSSVVFRVASCRIIGGISVHPSLTSFDVKKTILPLVLCLCQDVLFEVRATICTELPNVAKGLGGDNIVQSSLLSSLVELSSDDQMVVVGAAVNAVVLIIPFLNRMTIKATIIPLVKQLCAQSLETRNSTFPTVAKVFGQLLNNIEVHLAPEDCEWFLLFFRDLSNRGTARTKTPSESTIDPALGVTCRQFCAYNLPAVTVFTDAHLPNMWDTWYMIFKNLAHDSCYIVRKTVAGCIHEIAKILGLNNKIIKSDVVLLLKDDSEDVIEHLVPNIGELLELFSLSGVLSKITVAQPTLEIGRALIKLEGDLFKGYNWRTKMLFLNQLEVLPNCMPSDFIHQHFTPMVFNLILEARTKPVRSQASRTLLLFLRYNIKEMHRRWIRDSLVQQLCNSNSCYTRHVFIQMAIHAMEIFSAKYFKEHFLTPLLSLAEDPVSTVRLCFVKLTPTLKNMIELPVEKGLMAYIENVLYRLEMVEKDRDVLDMLKLKFKEMRQGLSTNVAVVERRKMEEKRKLEEEEKVYQGVVVSLAMKDSKAVMSPSRLSREKSTKNIRQRSTSTPVRSYGSVTSANDMSFLKQHFYIDAGVIMPEKIALTSENCLEQLTEDLKILDVASGGVDPVVDELVISNIDSLSETDLKELQTFTTNITDDVKVNLQKITGKGLLSKIRAPLGGDGVKKRSKRYSSVFTADCVKSGSGAIPHLLKRRSLNLASTSDLSRIPVCFKAGKNSFKIDGKSLKEPHSITTNMKKSQSINNINGSKPQLQKLEFSNRSNNKVNLSNKKFQASNEAGSVLSDEILQVNQEQFNGQENRIDANDIKENVPINDSISSNLPIKAAIKENVAKVSNLPVLIRRTQSAVRK